jgi:hypothetical protein
MCRWVGGCCVLAAEQVCLAASLWLLLVGLLEQRRRCF